LPWGKGGFSSKFIQVDGRRREEKIGESCFKVLSDIEKEESLKKVSQKGNIFLLGPESQRAVMESHGIFYVSWS